MLTPHRDVKHLAVGQNEIIQDMDGRFQSMFPLPGFHFGYLFLTHRYVTQMAQALNGTKD